MLNLGTTSDNNLFNITSNSLNNHAFVCAQSGAGKSALLIKLVEQLIREGKPVLLFDIKGDLANILKQDGELRNLFVGRLLTPGSSVGESVNLFAGLGQEDGRDQAVSTLLNLLGVESSKSQHSYHLFLTTIIKEHFATESFTLEDLLPLILEPQIQFLGMLELNDVLPFSARRNLAIKLNNLIADTNFDLWRTGISLDFDTLFAKYPDGKSSVVVYSVAHLTDETERLMALNTAFQAYLKWTIKQSGTKELRSVMVVDEAAGLLSPHPRNPVTKAPIMALIKQARAFGNSIVLSTQNAKDIDHKALSNCKLWIVGKLLTKSDRERMLEGFEGCAGFNAKAYSKQIASLQARQFLVLSDKATLIHTAECETILQGPYSLQDLVKLRENGYIFPIGNMLTLRDQMSKVWQRYKETTNPQYLTQYVEMEARL